jgi:hypothetical protein
VKVIRPHKRWRRGAIAGLLAGTSLTAVAIGIDVVEDAQDAVREAHADGWNTVLHQIERDRAKRFVGARLSNP